MSKTKSKNDPTLSRDEQRGFVWVWVISYVAYWFVSWLTIDIRLSFWSRRDGFDDYDIIVLFIIITTLLASVLQQRVTQRVLRQPIHAWIPISLLGAVASLFAFSTTGSGSVFTMILSLIAPIALVQTLWLFSRVKAAWLWPIASIISALFFALPFRNFYPGFTSNTTLMPMMLGFGVAHGVIQAVIMRHLWTRPKETEKAKQTLAAENLDHQESLARLTLNNTTRDILENETLLQQQRH